ncbi:unknown protein (plasmid) [Simkania negevensis Z]|uniref:Lipoprotein n=1 Tax=Simkania negevensis (strain ATCC VR-1471 / DSM 27360 / Z) TaxID=331113 RepID=F8L2W2_SIMNZ|nr:unknown protein [Simkania negevensis Z]
MCQALIKIVFFVILFFVTGCASYKIPIQTQNHPASSNAKISQIELSPILDIPESNNIEKQEIHVHPHH